MMKRSIILLIVFMFLILGCNTKSHVDKVNAKIGLIQTNGSKNDSHLTFYDEDLNEVGKIKFREAGMGSIEDNPTIYDNNVYIPVEGYYTKKDEKTILEVNLDTFDIQEYKTTQIAMNSVAVNEDYIFSSNNLNWVSYIDRVDKKTNDIKTIELNDEYITEIICFGDYLYVFSTNFSTNYTCCYVYDFDLNLIREIELEGAYHVKDAIGYEDYVIYINRLSDTGSKSHVGIIDIKNFTVEKEMLNYSYPKNINEYNDCFYIVDDITGNTKINGLTIYDLKTRELKEYKFDHEALQICILEDRLYVCGTSYESEEFCFYIYNLDDMSFVKEEKIKPHDNYYSYPAGFFVR